MQQSPLMRSKNESPAWRHRFTRVDGVELHWAELGERSHKPPVLLLHGLNDCYGTWREAAPRLARDRLVLAPDLPGHGLSARPDASYELGWYAGIVARWLDVAGFETGDVVGHSFGGGIAQMMLLECAARMRRLVLVSSGGLGREIAISLRLAAIPMVIERWGQRFMGPCTKLAVKAMGDVVSPEDLARLCRMNAQVGSARAFARTVHDIIDLRGQRRCFFDRAHELPALPPIAVLWGDRDRVLPFAHAEALASSVDGVRLVRFDGCGHYPHHEKPAVFAHHVREFLDAAHAEAARVRPREGGARSAASRNGVRHLASSPLHVLGRLALRGF